MIRREQQAFRAHAFLAASIGVLRGFKCTYCRYVFLFSRRMLSVAPVMIRQGRLRAWRPSDEGRARAACMLVNAAPPDLS